MSKTFDSMTFVKITFSKSVINTKVFKDNHLNIYTDVINYNVKIKVQPRNTNLRIKKEKER